MEKARDLVILHEARERLIIQNIESKLESYRNLAKDELVTVHLRSIKHEIEDKKFLNEYYRYYIKNKFKGYGIKFPKEMYNFEEYKRAL